VRFQALFVILGRRRARGSEKCKRVRVGFVDVGVVADELENRQEPEVLCTSRAS
jgi:hypothetical protein